MAELCLQDWANSIRYQLINDPARKQYSQRIREYGLDFLDAYLDDVLQQDNALDIFKTPGRKRISPKKPRAPPSRQLDAISEQENTDDDVFNDPPPPLNLKSKKHKERVTKKASKASKTRPPSPPRDPIVPRPLSPPTIVVTQETIGPDMPPESLAPSPTQEQRDLSMIAEDEEPRERSPAVVPPSPLPPVLVQDPPPSQNTKVEVPPTEESAKRSVARKRKASSPQPLPTEDLATKSKPQPPPEPSITHEREEIQEPIPVESNVPNPRLDSEAEVYPPSHFDEIETYEAPLKDEDDTTQHKTAAAYTSLPAPPPLRKSTRMARDPSMPVAPGMFAPVTPAPMTAPGMGKRTSWLTRVREARAMENAHKPNASSAPYTVPSFSLKPKRKSGEGADEVNLDEGLNERKPKLQKLDSEEQQPSSSRPQQIESSGSKEDIPAEESTSIADLGLTALKKRIEDIGNQRNKATGKPLDGVAAANVIAKTAEARAAVLASLAGPDVSGEALSLSNANEQRQLSESSKSESPRHARFSISELSSTSQSSFPLPRVESHSQRVSTTPPHSPPPTQSVEQAPRPVFSKPSAPVFAPPIPPKEAPRSPPRAPTRTFSPPSMTLGLGTRFSPIRSPPPSGKGATVKPTSPKPVFSKAPSPSNEAFSQKYQNGTFSKVAAGKAKDADDEDDSWPMEENQTETGFWTYTNTNVKDDTWSTSQPTTTRHIPHPADNEPQPISQDISGGFEDIDLDHENDMDVTEAFTEIRDLDMSKPTVALVKPSLHRTESQLSVASSESSNSQPVGFLGQATKFMNSVLGTGKKAKPTGPVKSLQLAAAAAKKQQEEEDKKATRMKEMEQRRQQALQRKAEEEKARVLEEEKKIREEGERRKREREEDTQKRPLKPAVKKEESVAKKPKLAVPESEKKEIKKVPSKTLTTVKSTSSLKAGTSKAPTPQPPAQAPHPFSKPADNKPVKPIPGSAKGKGKAAAIDDDISQPSQLMQNQMAARAKAQMHAASKSVPAVPSESIELPDINSEYSDSEDEDRKRTYNPPDWAQGEDFVTSLQEQSKLNPDDIFGPVKPLKMEEIFKTRSSKFRARSSSANWSGTDGLTVEEEREYARRMGYIK